MSATVPPGATSSCAGLRGIGAWPCLHPLAWQAPLHHLVAVQVVPGDRVTSSSGARASRTGLAFRTGAAGCAALYGGDPDPFAVPSAARTTSVPSPALASSPPVPGQRSPKALLSSLLEAPLSPLALPTTAFICPPLDLPEAEEAEWPLPGPMGSTPLLDPSPTKGSSHNSSSGAPPRNVVAVTGFGEFCGMPHNPTQVLIQRLQDCQAGLRKKGQGTPPMRHVAETQAHGRPRPLAPDEPEAMGWAENKQTGLGATLGMAEDWDVGRCCVLQVAGRGALRPLMAVLQDPWGSSPNPEVPWSHDEESSSSSNSRSSSNMSLSLGRTLQEAVTSHGTQSRTGWGEGRNPASLGVLDLLRDALMHKASEMMATTLSAAATSLSSSSPSSHPPPTSSSFTSPAARPVATCLSSMGALLEGTPLSYDQPHRNASPQGPTPAQSWSPPLPSSPIPALPAAATAAASLPGTEDVMSAEGAWSAPHHSSCAGPIGTNRSPVGQIHHSMSFKDGRGRAVWLHLGVGASLKRFKVETRAYNNATFGCPDQLGWCPWQQEIFAEDGSTSHFLETDLPVQWLLTQLRAQGFPVDESHDAGRFVCNYVYYCSLRYAKRQPLALESASCTEALPRTSLFVHVPPFDCIPEDKQLKFVLSLIKLLSLCNL